MSKASDNIRKRREELGMSQEELARKMGYTYKSAISKIERGDRSLRQAQIEKFAEVLLTTPARLMGWDEEPEVTETMDEYRNRIFVENRALFDSLEKMTPETRKLAEDYIKFLADKDSDRATE